MDEMEEGEISDGEDCATDAIDAPYKPLTRPSLGPARQQSTNNDYEELEDASNVGKNCDESDDETPASRILRGYKSSSSESCSDSDESEGPSSRKMKRVKNNINTHLSNGGDEFQKMASEYQRSRGGTASTFLANPNITQKKKANNIWGNLLNEEILTADLSDIAVGKSLKEFKGDRGAESYNYLQAQRDPINSKNDKTHKFRQDLDEELNGYWSKRSSPEASSANDFIDREEPRRDHAIIAGKKRSIKERLGRIKRSRSRENELNNLDDLSIPPPGVPRTIPDVPTDVLESLNKQCGEQATGGSNCESMESETVDSYSDCCYALGEELAAKLSEPKIELMVGVVELVGVKIALNLFAKTQKIEKDGGMMIKNGQRRRTPGGVFLHLLRELATSNTEPSIDPIKVKKFFAASEATNQRRQRQPKHKNSNHGKNNGGSFQAELAEFQRLSKKQKSKGQPKLQTSKNRPSNPLPDLLAFHNNQRSQKEEYENLLPEAPPNSVEPVERALSTYDDDFLAVEVDDPFHFDQF